MLLSLCLVMELLLLGGLPCPCLVLLTVTLLMLHILKVHTLLVACEVWLLPGCVPAPVGVVARPLLVLATRWLLKGPVWYLFFLVIVAFLLFLVLLLACMICDVLNVRLLIVLLHTLLSRGCLLMLH